MRDKNWKRLQKKVNKVVRAMNQNVYNDDLWLGRFYAHQIKASYWKFEDGSGGELQVWLEFVDRKTGKTKLETIDTLGNERFLAADVYWKMNDFITEYIKVWETEDPRKDKIDFRKRGR